MFSRLVLILVAGCLTVLASSVTGKTFIRRDSETSNASCLKTIISNNGDTTKFSFELNHPAATVTHCQPEAGERELWTIEPLSSDDTIQQLNLNTGSKFNNYGKGLTKINEEWEKKMDLLVETIANLEKRIEQIIPSTTNMVGGYKKVGNLSGLYKMHPVGMTWDQAKSMCEQEGAHLLVINNAEERNVVPSLFSQTSNIQCADWKDWAWIGVHDNMNEGNFWTVLGDSLNSIGYSYWVSGRPISNTKENCVSVNKNGAMYDSECEKKAPFICEV